MKKPFNTYGIKVLRKSNEYKPGESFFYRAIDTVTNALTSFFGSKEFYVEKPKFIEMYSKPVENAKSAITEDDFDCNDFENIEKEIKKGFDPAQKDDDFLEKMGKQFKEEIDEICGDMDIKSLVSQIKGIEQKPTRETRTVEIETTSSKMKKSSGRYPLVDAIKKYERSYESYEWMFEENPMFDDYLFE